MESKIYYKICYSNSIVIFFHDLINDKLDGIIEDSKSEGKIILQKHLSITCYNNVSSNTLALSMVRKAKKITQEEYDIAYGVVESMVNSDNWLISDNNIVPSKIVTETVYV